MSEHQAFPQVLEQSISLATELEQLLLEETAVLEGRDPDVLQALVERKQRVLKTMEEATGHLQRLVEASGQTFTPDGMTTFLREHDPTPEQHDSLSTRWKHLREVAARCELMNRSHAQSIERSRQRVDVALKIIRGEDDNGNVYTAQGLSQSGVVLGRTLSQA